MFAKTIVLSDAFLDMPLGARCLYMTMGMLADDDGFVNSPKSIMRQAGVTEDDLKILIAKKFVIPFETGVIVIKHWRINNYLQKDRIQPTKYQEELGKLIVEDNGAYTTGDVYTENVYIDKNSIDKNSIDKNSIDKDSVSTHTDPKHTYGEYKHVKLKDTEYQKLVTDYGKSMAESCITFLDEYIEMKGYKAKSHYLCIRKWVVDAVKEREQRTNRNNGKTQGDRVNEFMLNYINSEENDD